MSTASRRSLMQCLVGAATLLSGSAIRAQQSPLHTVGIIGVGNSENINVNMSGLKQGLAEQGLSEGRDVRFAVRLSERANQSDLDKLVSDLDHQSVSLIVATGGAGVAQAAIRAPSKMPVLFANGSDPVNLGLVESLSRPGGHATGISFFTSTLGPRRIQIMRELLPGAARVGVIANPNNPTTESDVGNLGKAAEAVGLSIRVMEASDEQGIDAAFAEAAGHKLDALLFIGDGFFSSRRNRIAALAAKAGIPTSYNNSQYVAAGGLISYGDDRRESYRQLGIYAGRILKGASPAELPVLQPTKFELAINLKAASSLGLMVPETLLAVADVVLD